MQVPPLFYNSRLKVQVLTSLVFWTIEIISQPSLPMVFNKFAIVGCTARRLRMRFSALIEM